ncbi:MAG: beta-ketoacyl-[acyl-carrier-protein] synthase family protein [Planctomycetaceae bacterium]|jgi:3-oxoacyl-[acyl-carrier-protein] synthase II|nr:beta-ketoacyl-[acyl-carrier-protein] synthase family protein [Planctomycetaceae bacterium]
MREVVITGIGLVSPIGLEKQEFFSALCEGRSGVGVVEELADTSLASRIGARVGDFDAKAFVKPRKNIKVMSRDIQMGFVAADKAWTDSAIADGSVDPDRFGVIFGADLIAVELAEMEPAYRACMAMERFEYPKWGSQITNEMFPLWMLKYLPNMPACHIAIGRDARGPNDSVTVEGASGLTALVEAVRAIDRGLADVMIAGCTSSRIHPQVWAKEKMFPLSRRFDDPAGACRPFDADRDGMVHGEGAGAVILEERSHAEARGAKIVATVRGFASTFQARLRQSPLKKDAVCRAIRGALADARMLPEEIGHVNANAWGTVDEDCVEAEAIAETLGRVPVTAPKSSLGNLGAGSGIVEMAASLIGLEQGLVPPTRNYQTPDPACPVNVVHGVPLEGTPANALVLSQSWMGHSVAVIVSRP